MGWNINYTDINGDRISEPLTDYLLSDHGPNPTIDKNHLKLIVVNLLEHMLETEHISPQSLLRILRLKSSYAERAFTIEEVHGR